jgi:hypothetical protein
VQSDLGSFSIGLKHTLYELLWTPGFSKVYLPCYVKLYLTMDIIGPYAQPVSRRHSSFQGSQQFEPCMDNCHPKPCVQSLMIGVGLTETITGDE